MSIEDITRKLTTLAFLRQKRASLGGLQAEKVSTLIPPEIRASIAEIEADFADNTKELDLAIKKAEKELKPDIIQEGRTFSGGGLMAVYTPGKATWDSKGLEGYALAHPEILALRSVGKPSISFRNAGEGDDEEGE